MDATERIDARELARRRSGGIDVTLFWKPSTGRVFVDIADEINGDAFRIVVAAADALDAFNHPYAYQEQRQRKEQTCARQ